MTQLKHPCLVKWPFFVGDALLLGLASFVILRGHAPMLLWEGLTCTGAVALAAGLGIWPFVLEYRVSNRLTEVAAIAESVAQIKQIEAVATQIQFATAQWQQAQGSAERTVGTARELQERMATEAAAFGEFLRKANDAEKSTLRLEVEKFHRAEKEWLQVVVRMLDHTFALHQAALRSGQAKLIEQLGQFQNACRDAARRLGLSPFGAHEGETFDPSRHQVADSQPPPPGARVTGTVATGYTFQGQMIRQVLVALQPSTSSQSTLNERDDDDNDAVVVAGEGELEEPRLL
jgi:molecular chaperone GrpE (heat shock protein)